VQTEILTLRLVHTPAIRLMNQMITEMQSVLETTFGFHLQLLLEAHSRNSPLISLLIQIYSLAGYKS
jgi:hypothetical protein